MFFMMDRALKRWEIAILFAVLVSVCAGFWLDSEQKALSEQVIRFHVIANSDSSEDQALKLQVRDAVLEATETFYPQNATLEEAKTALAQHLQQLSQVGQQVVEEQGYDYTVTATLGECWFPTKEYDGFAFPAGTYTALNIEIGAAEGQNWWCVAFPPLCMGAASETLETAAEAGFFSQNQITLITEENQGYVLKFKSMELLGQLKELF